MHFGYKPDTAAAMAEKTLAIRSGKADVHVTPLAQLRTEVAVIPSVTGNQLVVSHPLPLDERMIALAAAISGAGCWGCASGCFGNRTVCMLCSRDAACRVRVLWPAGFHI